MQLHGEMDRFHFNIIRLGYLVLCELNTRRHSGFLSGVHHNTIIECSPAINDLYMVANNHVYVGFYTPKRCLHLAAFIFDSQVSNRDLLSIKVQECLIF